MLNYLFDKKATFHQISKQKLKDAKCVFKNIKINSLMHCCSWQFEYNGENYGKEITTNDTTSKKQIVVVLDMVNTMKRLIKS